MQLLFLFLLGLSVGSFLNVLIDRLPKGQSIFGRSRCDHCRKTLKATDLIPVVSHVVLGGRCRHCRKKISLYYPLVEFVTGAAFVFVWVYLPPPDIVRVLYLALFSLLIVIFFSDLKYQVIPDEVQIAMFGLVFVQKLLHGYMATLLNGFVEGAIVAAPILLIYLVTRGRAMGFGDVKLSFIIGFLLGMRGGFVALYIAFVAGALVGLLMIFFGKKKLKSKIAFGPFLVIGTVTVLIFQKEINRLLFLIFNMWF